MSLQLTRVFQGFWKHLHKEVRRPTAKQFALRSVRSKIAVESLEGRIVPAAPLVSYVTSGTSSTRVVGTVYEDFNSNGVKDNGENGLSGWTVYLDLDNSGTLNLDAEGALEPSALTNIDGDFSIGHLRPGTYRVAEVIESGWTPTIPASQDLTVLNGKDNKIKFFNFSGGSIEGNVWNDPNGDGVLTTDPESGAVTESGLAGWTVYLDLHNRNVFDADEPFTLTDATGHYSFTNLPPDSYEVAELVPAGWFVSPGFDNRQTADVVIGGIATQNFANFTTSNGTIDGTIFNDVNIDGVRNTDPVTGDFSEPGLADWTVFLDLNSDGILDAGEPTAVTDKDGTYTFLSVTAGDYEVTEVVPVGWDVSPGFDLRQTVGVVAGDVSVAQDFANFTVMNGSIRGTVWNDLNRDGIRADSLAGVFTDPGIAGWNVFLDLNRNLEADPGEPTAVTDANGQYVFLNLQVGDYEVRELLPSGWEVAPTFSDSVGVMVFSGVESMAPDFANFNLATAVAGSVSGTIWNDLNGNGFRDAGDPGASGWTLFVDLNGNGILDVGEPSALSAATGAYTISGVSPGSVTIVEVGKAGWTATAPASGSFSFALRNGENSSNINFGNYARQEAVIRGKVFADTNKNTLRDTGEKGLAGITVYLDLNNDGILDAGEPQSATSADLFYTPAVDEAGDYSFTHLAAGTYTVRYVLPALLSATPVGERSDTVAVAAAEDKAGVDCPAVYRANEIHGVKFDDANGNHQRDAGEPGVGGKTLYIDLDRDNVKDADEPTTVSGADGSYSFTDLTPGSYVVREDRTPEYEPTYPGTTGGTLWPAGVSNSAVGIVTPTSIETSLAIGQSYRQTVSITLPNTGALTDMVDVFLLFDDTGSFVNNSPIVRAAFPDIIAQLQASLPGINLGFGVGRFEEYANFAFEYATGRPFVLNQPIVAANTAGYMTAIQAALNRTTPGYGGDQPETDIEALYQLVTGVGFDGNNNGSVLDSGAAGLDSTQLNPGSSGDVPSFASFTLDPSGSGLPAAGSVGGGGFRAGALPIILTATDTGFAYQPKSESIITGVGGSSVPISALTQTSRPTTPFNSGAGIQQTITALNALGALVIGLGTNPESTLDPRQGLESLSTLTGAVNRSTSTIPNGTANPIAPGDPLYFQIASGFASSVASGVVSAIQNAVTNVAVDITVQASDPRVHIINHSGVQTGIGSGQTATFDIEFVGDGIPHRFDLQFVRSGTNVILGSIPVVLGTPIPGDGYEFEDLPEGEIHTSVDFGSRLTTAAAAAPSIASMTPIVGPTTGGTIVIILGANFTGASAVTFGGSDAASFTVNSDAQITAIAPIHEAATVDVVVTTAAGSSSFVGTNDNFTYAAPAIASVVVNGGGDVALGASGMAISLASQSSIVKQILVTFNQAVTVASDAFIVTPRSLNVTHKGGAAPSSVPVATSVTMISPSEYLVTFSGEGTHDGGIINSGIYDLTTLAAKVSAAGETMTADRTDVFFAMFGTVDEHNLLSPGPLGDNHTNAFVDPGALFHFSDAFGSTAANVPGAPPYNVIFDANLDGTIDPGDLFAFSDAFGVDWAF